MTAQPCFQIICYNADAFLEPVLESLIGLAPIVAVEGPVRYFTERGYMTSADRTSEILHDLLPENRIVHGVWDEKDSMVNAAIPLVPTGTSHIFCVDADECWRADDLKKIFAQLDAYDSCAFKPQTFFGSFDRILTGFETRAEWIRVQRFHEGATWKTHRPPTILAPDGKPYRSKRHWDAPFSFAHYSYVMPRAVREKIEYYSSWGAGVIPNWFEKVYLPWVNGTLLQKAHIECEFNGVHEWEISRRGDCFTTEFTGTHPPAIQKRMPELLARFERELAEMRALNGDDKNG